jgi:class 3 adenylate cyclase
MDNPSELAILFADVVGSTRLYQVLGDSQARQVVGVCIDIMKVATERHGGRVIKTMGDEVMATFATPLAAIEAAEYMQRHIAANDVLQAEPVRASIRIGCHFGAVVQEPRDVFGTAVHIANRLTSQAKAGQIVTTASVVERLTPEWKMAIRQIDVASLKGQNDPTVLFEVLWQDDDLTHTVSSIASLLTADRRVSASLQLDVDGRSWLLNELSLAATLGRADSNTIVLSGELISRTHARLELVRTRFQLVDESTNGTYVQFDSGVERFVRRDILALEGSGLIGLGAVPQRQSKTAIRFRCNA